MGTMIDYNEIKDIGEIGNTIDGELLLMAIAKITSEYETNKTPDQILKEITDLANYTYGKPLEKSIKILCNELSKDKSRNPYYHTWQSNIAMAFIDEFDTNIFHGDDSELTDQKLKEIANNAAKRFLDQLIKE